MQEAVNRDFSGDVVLRTSPKHNAFIVEEHRGDVIHYKEISVLDLYYAINNSYENVTFLHSGLLPENCIHVSIATGARKLTLWNPELRADISYGGAEYRDFPIPRLVFGVRLLDTGRVADCTLGVIADGPVTTDTKMYYYPFSNVFNGFQVCMGNNVLPKYKNLAALKNFPRYLLGVPDNDDYFNTGYNQMHLGHKELLEHLKDKDPAYYYTHVLVESGKTLTDFLQGGTNV